MKLYIDPGTGSMLFSILIGVIGASMYSLRMLIIKLRQRFASGKIEKMTEKIPYVIYSDDKRYWTIFEPICRKMDSLGIKIVYLTASEDDPVFKCNYKNIEPECIGKGNRGFLKLNFLNATIVLSTTPGLDVYQWKRSKNVDWYVHIPHAASDITMYRMFGIDYYDAILLSGEYQVEDVRALEALRDLPAKELVKVGIPYMDDMVKRLERAEAIGNHNRTVLLAPSWGSSAIFSIYGSKIIDAILKTGYHLIIRPHPQSYESEKDLMEKLMKKYPESESLEWNKDADNFDVLRRADILISDFSGVIFDFALVYNKPIMYTTPNIDTSPYDVWWLKKEFWTLKVLPKLGKEINNFALNNLKELIDDCIENPCYEVARQEIKLETWEYYGEGTENTVRYLLEKNKELTKEEE